MSHSGGAQSKLMQFKRITKGGSGGRAPSCRRPMGTGAKPQADGQFWGFFSTINTHLSTIWITFSTFSTSFERTKFLKFESDLKELYTVKVSLKSFSFLTISQL